jgi:AraC-like DNA-binding protein
MVVPARNRFVELQAIPLTVNLGSFRARFIGWGFIQPSQWRNRLHTHSFFEICYAFSGSGVFNMMGKSLPIRRGDVFIAGPREAHEIIGSTTRPMGIYFWSYTLVPGEGTGDAVIDGLLRDFLDKRQVVSRRVPGMEDTLRLLTEEITRKEPGYQSIIIGLCTKLILDTARAALGAPRAGETLPADALPAERQLIDRARRYMQDNIGRALSCHDISQQTGLSERHFTRIFRQATGRSPMAYLGERRIETAGQLLLTGMSIKEIATRMGYSDVRYFTTVFREATGMPPAHFRAHHGTTFVDPAHDPR